MYCSKCGTENPNDAQFCHACGESTNLVTPSVTPTLEKDENVLPKAAVQQYGIKTKNSAGVLALLVGGLGVHKFYLGSWGWGLLYMFFVWTWVPLIIALGEAIFFFSMRDEDFNKKYNSGPRGPFSW